MGRVALPDGMRKYEIKKILDEHRGVIRMILLGHNNTEIGEATGYTPQEISYIRNSSVVREQLDYMNEGFDRGAVDIKKRIQEEAPGALDTLIELMKVAKDDIRAKVAIDLLDRAGHAPITRMQAEIMHLTTDDIAEIKNRARSADKIVDVAVEVSR